MAAVPAGPGGVAAVAAVPSQPPVHGGEILEANITDPLEFPRRAIAPRAQVLLNFENLNAHRTAVIAKIDGLVQSKIGDGVADEFQPQWSFAETWYHICKNMCRTDMFKMIQDGIKFFKSLRKEGESMRKFINRINTNHMKYFNGNIQQEMQKIIATVLGLDEEEQKQVLDVVSTRRFETAEAILTLITDKLQGMEEGQEAFQAVGEDEPAKKVTAKEKELDAQLKKVKAEKQKVDTKL